MEPLGGQEVDVKAEGRETEARLSFFSVKPPWSAREGTALSPHILAHMYRDLVPGLVVPQQESREIQKFNLLRVFVFGSALSQVAGTWARLLANPPAPPEARIVVTVVTPKETSPTGRGRVTTTTLGKPRPETLVAAVSTKGQLSAAHTTRRGPHCRMSAVKISQHLHGAVGSC